MSPLRSYGRLMQAPTFISRDEGQTQIKVGTAECPGAKQPAVASGGIEQCHPVVEFSVLYSQN